VPRFRFFRWDEAVFRALQDFGSLLGLFNYLLVQTNGDVDEALEQLRYLKEQGYLPERFDVEAFRAELADREIIELVGDGARLTRKGERGVRQSALEHVFGALRKGGVGSHAVPREGKGVEILSEKRAWQFGDGVEEIDFRGSMGNAIRRAGPGEILLGEEDLEVFETEHHTSCATALLLDISHSMILYGEDRITPAKQVALALTELIVTRYPKDTLDVVVFGDDAQEIAIEELPYVQVGPFHTNTKAALQRARQILMQRRSANKQILLITDGKPTVVREADGGIYRNTFGLDPKIVNRTLDEAVICRRKRIAITTFMVTRDRHLQRFVASLTELNHGRAYFSSTDRLGEFLLLDFISNRRRRVH
jgi:uncharacterized protein with von Willebrand factor type A (vWA) domain